MILFENNSRVRSDSLSCRWLNRSLGPLSAWCPLKPLPIRVDGLRRRAYLPLLSVGGDGRRRTARRSASHCPARPCSRDCRAKSQRFPESSPFHSAHYKQRDKACFRVELVIHVERVAGTTHNASDHDFLGLNLGQKTIGKRVQEIARLCYRIQCQRDIYLRHRDALSTKWAKSRSGTWNNPLICSSSIFMYLGLKTNWIARVWEKGARLPRKKFDFPEPFTPTNFEWLILRYTYHIDSRTKQLGIFCFCIAPKPLDNHLLNMHF